MHLVPILLLVSSKGRLSTEVATPLLEQNVDIEKSVECCFAYRTEHLGLEPRDRSATPSPAPRKSDSILLTGGVGQIDCQRTWGLVGLRVSIGVLAHHVSISGIPRTHSAQEVML